MRVLFESLFFDVTSPQDVRGPGHVIFRQLRRADVNLRVLAPPAPPPWLAERALAKIHRHLTRKRYLRFMLSQAARASAILGEEANAWGADVVLSMFPAALWRYAGRAPAVYRIDATYKALVREYAGHGYGRATARVMAGFQARACHRSSLLVTHSEWSRRWLTEGYGVPDDTVRIFPNTGGLPPEAVEGAERRPFDLEPPVELLFVGFDAERKGLDVAVEVLRLLQRRGTDARLRVCGVEGSDESGVRFLGRFDKSRPAELQAYADLYRNAHLLLHPARFDPSPMVVAEAAAFGVPTVTHDVGGLASCVLGDQTGVVLPGRSSAGAFADAIRRLVEEPERYRRLCRAARDRYTRQLSWDRFGDHLLDALKEAADGGRSATPRRRPAEPRPSAESPEMKRAARAQEDKYHLPYHWFPERRLPQFARREKERIVFGMIGDAAEGEIGRYLDLGCGDGRWTSEIHEYLSSSRSGAPESVGVDISRRAIGFAQLISPHIDFRSFAGERLPFADESFDLVTSIEVLEHLDHEHERLHLSEARRVLHPGGILLLTTPSRRLPMPPQHLRHYTVEGLTGLIRSCGLDILSVRGQGSPWASRLKKLRKTMNRAPLIWKPWRYFLRERPAERATTLLVAARRSPEAVSVDRGARGSND